MRPNSYRADLATSIEAEDSTMCAFQKDIIGKIYMIEKKQASISCLPASLPKKKPRPRPGLRG
jgi:hypothetical protein